jgi:4-amino-4-deoxy-L-arabinose transferase-like glycosyltransferase
MRSYQSKTSEHKFILTGIIVASVILKLFVFFMVFHGSVQQVSEMDSATYLHPAFSLLKSHQYLASDGSPMFFRTPGYPTFIAAVLFLFGGKIISVIFVQIFLSSLPIICIYLIARKIFSERIALTAAFLVAFDYLFIGYSYFILSETLFVCLICMGGAFGVYFFMHEKQTSLKKVCAHAFLFGFFVALATLTRPISYFLIIPILIGSVVFMLRMKYPVMRLGLISALLILPSILLVGGWQLRNKLVVGDFSYTPISSINAVETFFPQLIRLEKKKEHNRAAHENTVLVLLKHPLLLSRTVAVGAMQMLAAPDATLPRLFGDSFDINRMHQIKVSLAGFHFLQAKGETLELLSAGKTSALVYLAVTTCFNFVLYFLVIFSLVSLIRSKRFSLHLFAHIFLIGASFYFLLVASNVWSNARYRIEFQAFIDLYAAAGFVYLSQFLKARFTKRTNSVVAKI